MADRYWVPGGTGVWTSTTNWSDTDGGASGFSVPTATDNAYFSDQSGSGTVTVSAGGNCLDLDFTKGTGFTGTLDIPGSLISVRGSLTFSSGMLTTGTGIAQISMEATSGTKTINTNGVPSPGNFNINGNGATFQLLSDIVVPSTNVLNLSGGVFDANGFNVTCGAFASTSGVRTLTVGTGVWTITGNAGTVLSYTTGGTLTVTTRPTFNLSYSGGTGTRTCSVSNVETHVPNVNIIAGTDIVSVGGSNNLNFTGFSGSWSPTATNVIYGNLTCSATMTIPTGTSARTFAGTSGTKTINMNGVVGNVPFTFNGVGSTWSLISALDMSGASSRALTLTNGTLTTNGNNITCGSFSSSNSNTRTLNLGASTVILHGTGTVWNLATTTGMTLNAGTSTIKITDASATAKTFSGGGLTYNNIWLTGSGTGTFDFIGSNTFNDFKCDTPPHSIRFTAGTTTTVTTFTVSGTPGNLMTIGSITAASHALAKSGGGTISSDYLSVSFSDASPATTWYAGNNSTNGGNNTGWIFTAPPGPSGDTSNMLLVMQ